MWENSQSPVKTHSVFNAVEDVRKHFPIFSNSKGGKRLIYFDNAATAQKPEEMLTAIINFYKNHNANVNRGVYNLGEEATALYEDARAIVSRFIGAGNKENIIFTRNTTESINMVAHGWGNERLKRGDEIIISILEHHSNILPWREVCRKTGANILVIPMTRKGIIDIDTFEKMVSKKTRLVALTHVSNVLGTIQPIREVVTIAKKYDARVVIDGAQAVPHMSVDVSSLGVDAYVFSGHKVYGPTGIGVLYLREDFAEEFVPVNPGGGTVMEVTDTNVIWRKPPYKFEGGTPHIAGAVGLGAALSFIEDIGWEWILDHEASLLRECVSALKSINGVSVLGEGKEIGHGPIAAFTVKGVHPHDLASALNEEGIAIRAGTHCAEPLHRELGIPATARASFGIYNTLEEVRLFTEALEKARKFLH